MKQTLMRRKVAIWIRLVCYLLVVSLLHAYAGGQQVLAALAQSQHVARQNQRLLSQLGVQEPLTDAQIAQRKAAARLKIRQSRADLFARQEANLREKRAYTEQAWQLQQRANAHGLSQVTADILETARQFLEVPGDESMRRQQGQRLFYLGESLEHFVNMPGARPAYDVRTLRSADTLTGVLKGLGPRADQLDLAQVQQVALSVKSLAQAMVAERADEPRGHGGRQPNALYAGRDAWTGRPNRPIPSPRARWKVAPSSLPELSPTQLLSRFKDVPSAQANAKLASLGTPTQADLNPTLEVTLDGAVAALANSLGKDPLKIYQHVLNNIEYRLYAGSYHGALGTLETGVGNDVDQASLLVALLRAANIPARYETGMVTIPSAWVPKVYGFADLNTAASALYTAGIPATVSYNGSAPAGIKVQRTWVRAYVTYSNYRGVTGSSTGTSVWVALDPGYKDYQLVFEKDISSKVTFPLDTFFSASTSLSPLEFYGNRIRDYLATQNEECKTLETVTAHLVNQPRAAALLPLQLPWDVPGTTVSAAELSASQRGTLQLQLLDSYGYDLLNTSVSFPELYGKRLAITFPASTSSIYSSVSGTVYPTLSLDGKVLARGSSVQAGAELPLFLTLSGQGDAYVNQHTLTAGSTQVVTALYAPVSERVLADARAAHQQLVTANAPANQLDLAIGYVAGLTYFSRLLSEDNQLAGMHGSRHFNLYEGTTGTATTTTYAWGVPSGAVTSGYLVDAHVLMSSAPFQGSYSQTTATQLYTLSGYNSSFHEHRVWEEIIEFRALSSTNILQLARLEGQTIYYLDDIAEYNSVATQLAQPTAVTSAITKALNQGNKVITSTRSVTRGGKTVSGYIISNPTDGTGKYMISSGNNGGESTEESLDLNDILAAFFGDLVQISSWVNLTDGSLQDETKELSFHANGASYEIHRSYHSSQDQPSELGPGWNWTFGERLIEDPSTGNVVRLNPEAVKIAYLKNSNGTYTPPAGQYDVLAKTSSGFTLTTKSKTVTSFSTAGLLLKITDKYGNVVSMTRDGQGKPVRLSTGTGTKLLDFTTDSQGLITKMVDLKGDQVTLTYTGGRLTGFTDARGHTWSYTYDGAGRLIGKVEGDQVSIGYSFDGEGRLARYGTPLDGDGYLAYDHFNTKTTLKTPDGAESLYTYDSSGNLLEEIGPTGNKKSYEYTNGQLTKETDARGGVTTRAFDAKGNMTQEVDPSGATITQTWDSDSRPLSQTDASGSWSAVYKDSSSSYTVTNPENESQAVGYNSQGLLNTVTRSDGTSNSLQYDAQGRLTGSTDGEGKTTTYATDAAGNITKVTAPDGSSSQYTFEADGSIKTRTAANGETMSLSYTARGQVAGLTDAQGKSTSLSYTGPHVMAVTDPEGRVARLERNPKGDVVAYVNPLGQRTDLTLDAAGRVVAMTDQYGNSTEFNYCADVGKTPCDVIDPYGNLVQRTFDASGRLIEETSDLGTWTFEYDGLGRQVARVDPLGNRTEQVLSPSGRLLELVDALNQTTTYTYNQSGLVTGLTDPAGSTVQYVRDGNGRLEQLIDALNRVTHYNYDSVGRLVSRVDANGNTVSYTTDNAGRVLGEDYADGTSHTFTYDTAGHRTGAASADADLEYQYQGPDGKLSKIINHTLGLQITYAYDPATGLPSQVQRPDGTVKYGYNLHGKLTSLELPDGSLIALRYDRFGRLSEKRFPNGVVQRDSYDSWGRLVSRQVYDRSSVLLAGYAYTYDALGRRLSATDTDGNKTSYKYDALSRLVEEKDSQTKTYTYDAAGNRLTLSVDGVEKERYTYDTSHRLTKKVAGTLTTTFTYDENGNRKTKAEGSSTTTYTYDGANRLKRVDAPGKTALVLKYDAEGRRVYRADARGTVSILNEGEDAILEVDGSGKKLRGLVHGPGIDEPLALLDHQTGKVYFFHADAQGSIIALSNAAGQLSHRYRYAAFGERTELAAQTQNDVGFHGRPLDPEQGLADFRARNLDPSTGRFLQSDPRHLAARELPATSQASMLSQRFGLTADQQVRQPQTLHPYNYAANDPVNLVDLSGELIWGYLASMMIWGFIFALIMAVVSIVLQLATNGMNWDQIEWEEVGYMAMKGFFMGMVHGLLMFGPLPLGRVVLSQWGPAGGNKWVIVGGINRLNYFRAGIMARYGFDTGHKVAMVGKLVLPPFKANWQAWILGHWWLV